MPIMESSSSSISSRGAPVIPDAIVVNDQGTTVSPAVAGNYFKDGTYNGAQVYMRQDGAYHVWWNPTFGNMILSVNPGDDVYTEMAFAGNDLTNPDGYMSALYGGSAGNVVFGITKVVAGTCSPDVTGTWTNRGIDAWGVMYFQRIDNASMYIYAANSSGRPVISPVLAANPPADQWYFINYSYAYAGTYSPAGPGSSGNPVVANV